MLVQSLSCKLTSRGMLSRSGIALIKSSERQLTWQAPSFVAVTTEKVIKAHTDLDGSTKMAKQRITTRRRTRKTGGNTGYKKCPNCGGDGRVKVRKK